ncbi:L-ascorbate metabolism protein UlaG, beta-lactamase superfamily [Paenibacillus catalpae]|uniref:L-ascorbate metabolism protein UlaG, beta-lactamase superfamily n=1 Tax=Paenibacillus catalpae TaxID=1045775 RepID=A0A1I2BLQ3_9BACL|nr:MBL fold metallo-hydrolase [Paenibacillus catalpae]SFE57085.1 L-ascorbate metabolism protein UlaG, beta-lactamase superfamily [Paenibacillus catalpae]
MNIQLIRHATIWLEYAGVQFLVDPMLSEAGANPPISNSTNDRRNPLVPLPIDKEKLLQPDVILVTHLHADHWDTDAADALPKSKPLYCQPGDAASISAQQFSSVTEIEESISYQGITISRTSGQHGTGEIGKRMGQVSGFVLQAEGEPTLYIAGDTIWCDEVKHALDTFQPDVTVVNAGGAQFAVGDPITMNAEDVIQVCRYAPNSKVVAVHMDTINHCLVTREDLADALQIEGLLGQVLIPADGESVIADK